jgi:hypothetical protein
VPEINEEGFDSVDFFPWLLYSPQVKENYLFKRATNMLSDVQSQSNL